MFNSGFITIFRTALHGTDTTDTAKGVGICAISENSVSTVKKLSRSLPALIILLLLPVITEAYTIVMRDGRQIEIPDSFHLTQTTLTYEAAPGIQITVQVRHIDAAATERANGETPGAFFRRANLAPTAQTTQSQPERIVRSSSRTLTNRDLSDYARTREASERAYERRRRELNLPAPVRPEDDAALRQTAERLNEREAESERYWRTRAAALRAEIVSLDAEINFLRARLAETPEYSALNATVVSTSGVFGAYSVPFGLLTSRPHVGINHTTGAQIAGQINFGGGATRGIINFNAGSVSGSALHRVVVPPRARPVAPFFGVSPVIAYPYFNYPSDRSLIISRLNELGAARAAFAARWQLLEDEARRAGALPGWLR
jgi:hypothetical protein